MVDKRVEEPAPDEKEYPLYLAGCKEAWLPEH
jgi:hypothetical protein